MHKDSENDTAGPEKPETAAEKKLTEALLAEHARAGADADEDFVADVESALDAGPAAGLTPSPHYGVASWWRMAAILIGAAVLIGGGAAYVTAEQSKRKVLAAIAEAKQNRAKLEAQIGTLNSTIAANEERISTITDEAEAKAQLVGQYEVDLGQVNAANKALTEEFNELQLNLKQFDLIHQKYSDGPTVEEMKNQVARAKLQAKPSAAPRIPPLARAPATKTATSLFAGASRNPSGNKSAIVTGGTGRDAAARADFFEHNPGAGRTLMSFRGERDAAPVDRERYGELVDNRWQAPYDYPLSTFSIDVDTASYTNLRRMIRDRVAIPKDAVRIEEMINYFDYDYPEAEGEHPFAFAIETASCPWNEDHRLVRVGLKGKSIARDHRPRANLVFLLDVSGSMDDARKLPLLVDSMKILLEELNSDDIVSIVVYAGAEGLALPPTPGSEKKKILGALDRLKAGGSTNGGAGIQLAYKMATENFIEDGVNRVILCTDGDFNVGRTVQGDLVDMVVERASGGTFLSVLGFGTGNINDSMLESITNKGNGNYFYIDSITEGRKVLLEDLMSTLVTIAKDVKIQVEFNPEKVGGYRLIGYANRMLEAEDFDDDTVDAGEVGAGHRVTALYEIIPAALEEEVTEPLPELKYQRVRKTRVVPSEDLLTVKLRYKEPDSDVSKKLEVPIVDSGESWRRASDDFQFASAVALFGMILRESEYIGDATLVRVIEAAAFAKGQADPHQRREEFRELVSLKIARP